MKKKTNKVDKNDLKASSRKKYQTKDERQEFIDQLINHIKEPISEFNVDNTSQLNDNIEKQHNVKKSNVYITDQNQLIIGKDKYQLTPKGILWATLDNYYHIGGDMDKFHDFMKELLKHLSMLISNNEMMDMFGDDFNDFFEVIIKTINLTGKMKMILEENGIEFNVKEFLDKSIEDQEISMDEDDGLDSSDQKGKPKKKK